MSDFPAVSIRRGKTGVLSTFNQDASLIQYICQLGGAYSTTVTTAWPASGLGIYVPVMLEVPATIYQMSVLNGATIDGTVGVAIYDESFNRLTTVAGATHTGASVVQSFDVPNITVMPGVYYLMMCAASTTATYALSATTVLRARPCGVLQQSSITDTPPNPGVPATFAQTVVPAISAHYRSTV